MTQAETRQLGIEFERRCQTIDPTMEYIGKMDTDDIYSFLNLFVVEYVKQAYLNKNKVEKGTPEYEKIALILDSLIKEHTCSYAGSNGFTGSFYNISNQDKILEINSAILINAGVEGGINSIVDIVQNSDLLKLRTELNKNYILKVPIAAITLNGKLDFEAGSLYERLSGLVILKCIDLPTYFGPTDECELPMLCFDDIVTGAVLLYFNHKAALTKSDNKNDKKTEES